MNNFYRGSNFGGVPSTRAVNPGARPGQVSAPAISGSNVSSSGVGRSTGSGHAALPASCPPVISTAPPNVVPGVVMDERLAHLRDEGQNASNAQGLREHVEGKQFQGMAIEDLINSVVRAEEHAAAEKVGK